MADRKAAWVTALAFFIVDQLTKWIVIGPLRLQERYQIELLPIFNLTWTENRGISLGMAQADSDLGRWLLVGGTAAGGSLARSSAATSLRWRWCSAERSATSSIGSALGTSWTSSICISGTSDPF
jgi:signal peptidase II